MLDTKLITADDPLAHDDPQAPDHGLVLYSDGSFRRNRAGWGVHGYFYTNIPLTRGIGLRLLPTHKGYHPVELPATATPLEYIDHFGPIHLPYRTNNTAELEAFYHALQIAIPYLEKHQLTTVRIWSDSEYVLKGFAGQAEKWEANGWRKADGSLLPNQESWARVLQAKRDYAARGWTIDAQWVKGHSGNPGNEYADINARTGSGTDSDGSGVTSTPEKYHNPTYDDNPLIMKTRMLFNIGTTTDTQREEPHEHYYFYSLGRSSNYGHKQGETVLERLEKTDLLLGRKISDAAFAVVRLDTPDPYLTTLKTLHETYFRSNMVELAVARLDNAYKPMVRQHLERHGAAAVCPLHQIHALLTPNDELLTKTHRPPRLAMDAVSQFIQMERQLGEYLAGDIPKAVTVADITAELYGEKKGKTVLHPHITQTTPYLEYVVPYREHSVTLRMVLGIEVPHRNALARLASPDTTVAVLVSPNGPLSYTYTTVFKTPWGSAIYQSPYTQFVIPKS